MSDNEKVTFGATIEPSSVSDLQPPPSRKHLSTIVERDSKASSTMLPSINSSRASTPACPSPVSPTTPQLDYDPANPFSAFYEHGSARRSTELTRPQPSLLKDGVQVTERDLEAGFSPISQQSSSMEKPSIEVTKECTMWPSQKTLKAQRKEQKSKDRMCSMCTFWGRLSKKQRILFQVLIALLVVGAAVGIGVGVSKAVGGGVWAGQGQTKQFNKGG